MAITDANLADYIRRRDDLFRSPTVEGARALMRKASGQELSTDKVALAAVHKARLQWNGCTDEMRMQSISWLLSNGFKTDMGAIGLP